MTENEAFEILSLSPEMKKEMPNLAKVYEVAVKVFEEIQEYRAIGTAEECRTAVERMKPKALMQDKVLSKGSLGSYYKMLCPNCGKVLMPGIYLHPSKKTNACGECGQRIDWSKSF